MLSLGDGIAIGMATIAVGGLVMKYVPSRNGKVCSAHQFLLEDIKEIKDDVKSLVKYVLKGGGDI